VVVGGAELAGHIALIIPSLTVGACMVDFDWGFD